MSKSVARQATARRVSDRLTRVFRFAWYPGECRARIVCRMESTTPPPESRIWRTPIQVRLSDTDALGHVNNATLISYLEHGRRALFRIAFPEMDEQLVIASLKADFLVEVLPSEAVEVEVSVERIGTSSITLNEFLLMNGEIAVRGQTVIVHLDAVSRRPAAIPASVRETLRIGMV